MHLFIYFINYLKAFKRKYILDRKLFLTQTHFYNLTQWKVLWPHDHLTLKDYHQLMASRHDSCISEQNKEMAFEQGILMLLKPSEFRISLVKFWLSAYNLSCTGFCLQILCGIMHSNAQQLWRLEIHLDYKPHHTIWNRRCAVVKLNDMCLYRISQTQQHKHKSFETKMINYLILISNKWSNEFWKQE